MPAIRTPKTAIDAQLDQIQKQTERNFQEAFQQINRAKARLFWDAGYQQCIKDYGLDKPLFPPQPDPVADAINPDPTQPVKNSHLR